MARYVVVVSCIVCTLLGTTIGIWGVPYILSTPSPPDPAEQYYRGVYDMCRAAMFMAHVPIRQCTDDIVPSVVGKDWYGQASVDWIWPIPEK